MDGANEPKILQNLLSGDENESKEFKSAQVLREPTHQNKKKIAEQLVSFANSGGGQILFGIDDDNRVEGKSLDEEKSVGTISQIARMKCQPPVSFSYRFFSESSGDLEDGAVFLLDVEPRKNTPHAIVDNSGGEIRKREYRLRSGDESRLVTDNELKWLFENEVADLGMNCTYRGWLLFDENAEYIGKPKQIGYELPESEDKNKIPTGSRYLLNYLDRVESEEIDGLDFVYERNKAVFMAPLVVDLVPFAFQISLIKNLHNSQNNSTASGMDLEMKEVNLSDISIEGKGTYLPNFDINPLEATKELVENFSTSTLKVPQGCEVKIELADEHLQLGAIGYGESKIIFRKQDKFRIELVIRFVTAGVAYPKDHPEEFRRITQEEESFGSSMKFSLDFSANFGFPEEKDDYIKEHQAFAERIKRIVESEWDSSEWVSEKQNKMIFEVNAKLERLLDNFETDEDQNVE